MTVRGPAPRGAAVIDRLIRITTALAVVAVAGVAAIISYQYAYELVARLLPFTVDKSHMGSLDRGARR